MRWRADWGLKCYHRYILNYFAIIKDMRRRSAEKIFTPKSVDDNDDNSDEIYPNNDPTRRNQALWRVPIGDCYTNGPMKRGRAMAEDVRPVFAELIDHCNLCCEKDEGLEQLRQQRRRQQQEDQEEQSSADNNETETEPQSELDQETADFLADRWDELQSKGSYLNNMIRMDGKRPYLTAQKGYLGMAPGHAQPGDVVVLLCGDSIPYVLRPTSRPVGAGAGDGDGDEDDDKNGETDGDGSKKYYTFIGEAYCDVIMDGELEGRLEEEREDFFLV